MIFFTNHLERKMDATKILSKKTAYIVVIFSF